MLAEKELTEEDKFYSEAQVAWDAVSEAFNRVVGGEVPNTLNEAQAREALAESLDKLALILDRGESKNWKFISRSNNVGEPNVEYCRTAARQWRMLAEEIRVMVINRRARGAALLAHFVSPTDELQKPMDNCPICSKRADLIENPVECQGCHTKFCSDCMTKWLSNYSEDDPCPACSRCSVCFKRADLIENPLVCPQCKKPFCHDCIAEWLNEHDSCPCCRQRFN